ncbi:hypothetical protein OHT59_22400 [Streptomyces sp. NBC_00243]|uniref:hypothetical protein n=1 Tax=Streptomyces sp. NBC_00243 TaxID=2975688 RepID=UPI002DDA74C2|nr:hypothetical protein [Streptomyces sp. NBC_00243]WRZ21054.1 hypothetical protein OHT59_22400 [Streptomyces sp. NBC_00243]
MDITSLTVVLSVVVIAAAAVLTASNEPPLWVYALTCTGSWPLSSALFNEPAYTSAVGNGAVGEWAVRIAIASTLTALLSFAFGRESRAGADDEHTGDALSA